MLIVVKWSCADRAAAGSRQSSSEDTTHTLWKITDFSEQREKFLLNVSCTLKILRLISWQLNTIRSKDVKVSNMRCSTHESTAVHKLTFAPPHDN